MSILIKRHAKIHLPEQMNVSGGGRLAFCDVRSNVSSFLMGSFDGADDS
jgi:hypothetical protein